MPPRIRKIALTAHVIASVGWIGAIAAFLGLATVGLTSHDAQAVRGAYLVMEPAAWFVLVPLAFASVSTGLIMSLGTAWGLFRHYWVLFKLVIGVFATIILLIYMDTFRFMASVAADPGADLSVVRNASPGLHAVLALLVLGVANVLAIYKPRGMTRYGWRKLHEERAAARPVSSLRSDGERDAAAGTGLQADDAHGAGPRVRGDRAAMPSDPGSTRSKARSLLILLAIIALLVLVIALHLVGGSFPGH